LFASTALAAVALASAESWAARQVTLKRYYQKGVTKLDSGPALTTEEGSQHLDIQHYTNVRDAALAMLKKYPPANHFYVSLGRSPVSLYTFLHALDPNMTTTFPASDLKFGITEENHAAYFRHFEKYIPKDVLQGKRGDIVVFDRSHNQSGSSLAALKPVLEKYLKKMGYKTKVVMLGFAGAGPLQSGVHFISTAKFPNLFRYFSGRDEDENVATYVDHHTIGEHGVNQLTKNKQHPKFEKAMMLRMTEDATLDKALTSESHLKIFLQK
jgi:hypothetical protein